MVRRKEAGSACGVAPARQGRQALPGHCVCSAKACKEKGERQRGEREQVVHRDTDHYTLVGMVTTIIRTGVRVVCRHERVVRETMVERSPGRQVQAKSRKRAGMA